MRICVLYVICKYRNACGGVLACMFYFESLLGFFLVYVMPNMNTHIMYIGVFIASLLHF
jgi:hypothetical protein